MSAEHIIGRVRDGYRDRIRTDPHIDWQRIPREYVAIARNVDDGWNAYTSVEGLFPDRYYWRSNELWKSHGNEDLLYIFPIHDFRFDPGIRWDLAIFIRPGVDGTPTADDRIKALEDRMRKLEESSDPVLLRRAMAMLQSLLLNESLRNNPDSNKPITDLLNQYHANKT